MAKDKQNIYKNTPKQIEWKIGVFSRSPLYDEYLV